MTGGGPCPPRSLPPAPQIRCPIIKSGGGVVIGHTALFRNPKAVHTAASVGQLLAALGAYDQERHRCGISAVSHLLCADGALAFQQRTGARLAGTLALHAGKARRVLQAVARFANTFAFTYHAPEFTQCRPAFQFDYLYSFRHIQSRTSEGLFCCSIPSSPGGVPTMVPIVLAIRKDSAYISDALGLAEYLCSKETQREFALLGEALPARNDVASLPEVIAANPLPRATQERLFRHGVLFPDTSAELHKLLSGIDAIGDAMLSGRIPLDTALDRIALLCG